MRHGEASALHRVRKLESSLALGHKGEHYGRSVILVTKVDIALVKVDLNVSTRCRRNCRCADKLGEHSLVAKRYLDIFKSNVVRLAHTLSGGAFVGDKRCIIKNYATVCKSYRCLCNALRGRLEPKKRI